MRLSDELLERHVAAHVVQFGLGTEDASRLRPEDFSVPALGAVIATARTMVDGGEAVTPDALYERMLGSGRASLAGDGLIRTLGRHALPGDWSLSHGVARLRELGKRRRMAELAAKLSRAARAGDDSTYASICEAGIELSRSGGAGRFRRTDAHGLLAAALEEAEARMRRRHVFDLTSLLAPLASHVVPGNMITIGGQTGAGKSSMALWMALAWHRATGGWAHITSLEDRWGTWGDRWQSTHSGVSLLSTCVDSTITNEAGEQVPDTRALAAAMQRVSDAAAHMHRDELHVSEMMAHRVADVLESMREGAAAGATMLVVDYIQEIGGVGGDRRGEKVAECARLIKGEAKRLRLPLILCSQLKRVEGREPGLSDLKESGDLENMSEAVVILWRSGEDRAAPTNGKVAKLKSSSERPRFQLVRNAAGTIDTVAELLPDDEFSDGPRRW